MPGHPSAGGKRRPFHALAGAAAVAIVLIVQALPAGADIMPPERRTTWNPGIPGGVPVRTTVCATVNASTYGNGTSDATSGIQAAVNACPVGQVVQLSAGDFLVSGAQPIVIGKGIVLRGAGTSATRLRKTSTVANPVILIGERWPAEAASVELVASASKDATSVQVASSAGFTVGQLVLLDELTDNAYVSWGTNPDVAAGAAGRGWFTRYDRPVGQMLEIASISGNTITFTTPLHIAFDTSYAAQLTRYTVPYGAREAGVEDLYVRGGLDDNVTVRFAVDSWVKNVESDWSTGASFALDSCLRCVLRDSYAHDTPSPYPGGGGVLLSLARYTADSLVENSIFINGNKVMVMRASGGGNVIGYNYFDDGFVGSDLGWVETGLDASEMACPHFELFEGNQAFNIDGDDTWGGAVYNTFFRNHATGQRRSYADIDNRRAIGLRHGQYYYSFVGNVLGTPDEKPTSATRLAPEDSWPWTSDPMGLWRIGYTPLDWDAAPEARVVSTIHRHGNFEFASGSIDWESGYDQTLPDSLYLTEKPAFFGTDPWPWVDPTGASKLHTLPARARYDAGSLVSDFLTCPMTVAPGAAFTTTVTGGVSAKDWMASYVPGSPNNPWLGAFKYVPLPRPATVTMTAPATVGTYELRLFADDAFTLIGSCSYQVGTGPALPTLSINNVTVTEGNTGTVSAIFNVTLSAAATGTVTVGFATANGTATAGSDYVASSGTLTFNPGDTLKTVTVLVNGDTTSEANETFFVNLSAPSGATLSNTQGQGTITDNDASGAALTCPATVAPGAAFTATVSGGVSAKDWMASYVPGSPNNPWLGAFKYVPLPRPATVTLTAPATAGTYEVRLFANDTFTLIGSCPYQVGTGSGLPTLSINNVTVTEGNTGTVSAIFNVTLSAAATGTVTVSFATSNGTATAGSDYVANSGTLTFNPGDTLKTMTVLVNGDTTSEANETFFVNLSAPSGATLADIRGQGTITDNDAAAGPVTCPATVAPGAILTTAVSGGVSAKDWMASYASGSPNSPWLGTFEYVPLPRPATVAMTAPAAVGTYEVRLFANDTFTLIGSCPYQVGTGPALPTLSINNVTVTEGNTGTVSAIFNVTLSAAATGAVTVSFATSNGTATAGSDYVATSGTLTFNPGDTVKTVTVLVSGDTTSEANETFFVNLSAPSGATLADIRGQGTITDNDASGAAVTCPVTMAPGAAFNATVSGGVSATDWTASYVPGSPNNPWLGAFKYVSLPRPATVGLAAPATPGTYELRLFANDTFTLIGSCTYQVATAGDGTPPSVSITAPAAAATVSGTVAVSANASDNVGVAGVQFRLDGANLGAEDAASPYSVSWNTTAAANGSHTLTAVARDAAGNVTTSAGVTVTVSNDATPPSVSITSPAAASTVSGTTTVSANASDNVAVAGVQFKLDGANLGAEDTSSPYSVSWNTTGAANGSHNLTALARDAAGNATTSATVNVTVANAGVLTLTPQDTYIGLDATNHSTSAELNTYTWPDNKVANAILMKFDLSALPVGAVVVDATLQLALVSSDPSPDGTYDVTAHKVVGKNPVLTAATGYTADGVIAWTPNTCCSNNVPLAQADISAAYDTRAIDKTPGPKTWSVTGMVQEWVASPTTNSGLLLNSDDSRLRDRYRTFASAENGDPTLRPFLRISYSLSPDVTPPLISAVAASAISASGGAINWTTNEASNSQVEYGTTTAYGSLTALNASLVTSHSATLGGLTANTLYHYRVRSRDVAGNLGLSADFTLTTLAVDLTAPTVSVTAPAASATVSGAVTVTASASDNVGVAGVQLKVDGINLGAEDTSAPYSRSWDTTTGTDGSHTLTAVARDAAGNQTTSAGITVTVSNSTPGTGIAALYPGDIGIEANPNVVFVERFDEPTLTDLFGRWTDILNGPAMLFSSDVPPGSPGTRSLDIPWVGGGVNDGGHLYKVLNPGVDDTLYVRYYIKYPTSGTLHHSGIWMGGANPSLNWPNPQAGTKPVGNDRFIASAEPSDSTLLFDHYDYWMDMHVSGDGNYWGNLLLNDPDVRANRGQWMCVEQMVKLNSPVTSSNGEHAIWIDGLKVSHVGPGFPNGSWSGGIFTQNPSGIPFPGMRWRSDANLKLNWIWLQNFSDNDPAGFQGHMRFDHVVVAKSYIGCLSPAAPDPTPPLVTVTAPSAGVTVSGPISVSAGASDNVGVAGVQFKLDGANLGTEDTAAPYSVSWNTAAAPNGGHTLTAVARDAAGNQTASSAVAVTVSNTGGPAWPNEPSGLVALTDQPWNALVGGGWNRRSGGTDQIIADSTAPLSPQNVLEYIYPVGLVDGVAPATQYYPVHTKEVFAGMWWKPSNPWQGDASNVNKIQFFQVQNSSVYMTMYGPRNGPFELRCDAQWPEQGTAWLTPNVNSGVVSLGQWHRLEWYMKYDSTYGAGDGIIRWWLDGVLVGNYTNVRFPNDGGFVEYQISPTWGGNTGDVKTQTDYYRFDHSYLSRR